MTSVVSKIYLHDHNCGLKAYRKHVVKTISVYGELHRFIPVLANSAGFKVTESNFINELDPKLVERYALPKGEIVYFCEKI